MDPSHQSAAADRILLNRFLQPTRMPNAAPGGIPGGDDSVMSLDLLLTTMPQATGAAPNPTVLPGGSHLPGLVSMITQAGAPTTSSHLQAVGGQQLMEPLLLESRGVIPAHLSPISQLSIPGLKTSPHDTGSLDGPPSHPGVAVLTSRPLSVCSQPQISPVSSMGGDRARHLSGGELSPVSQCGSNAGSSNGGKADRRSSYSAGARAMGGRPAGSKRHLLGVGGGTSGVASTSSAAAAAAAAAAASVRNRRVTHVCDICKKEFHNSSAFAKHKITHQDERKYQCDKCGKNFKRQDHLNGHKLVHEEKKPHACRFCDKSYADSRSLHRHYANTHTDQYHSWQRDEEARRKEGREVDPDNPLSVSALFRCSECEKSFRSQAALNGHMRLHGGYVRGQEDGTSSGTTLSGEASDPATNGDEMSPPQLQLKPEQLYSNPAPPGLASPPAFLAVKESGPMVATGWSAGPLAASSPRRQADLSSDSISKMIEALPVTAADLAWQQQQQPAASVARSPHFLPQHQTPRQQQYSPITPAYDEPGVRTKRMTFPPPPELLPGESPVSSEPVVSTASGGPSDNDPTLGDLNLPMVVEADLNQMMSEHTFSDFSDLLQEHPGGGSPLFRGGQSVNNEGLHDTLSTPPSGSLLAIRQRVIPVSIGPGISTSTLSPEAPSNLTLGGASLIVCSSSVSSSGTGADSLVSVSPIPAHHPTSALQREDTMPVLTPQNSLLLGENSAFHPVTSAGPPPILQHHNPLTAIHQASAPAVMSEEIELPGSPPVLPPAKCSPLSMMPTQGVSPPLLLKHSPPSPMPVKAEVLSPQRASLPAQMPLSRSWAGSASDGFLPPLPGPPSAALRKRNRPAPLVIPPAARPPAGPGPGYISHMRSPRLWDPSASAPTLGGGEQPAYTPPPMLSPVRKGSGLYFNLFVGGAGPRSAPVTPKLLSGLGSSLGAAQRRFSGDAAVLDKLDKEEEQEQEEKEERPVEEVMAEELAAEEEEMVEDPNLDPVSTEPHINIGERFQADLPDFTEGGPSMEELHLSEHADLIWDPSCLKPGDEEQLEHFLRMSCSAAIKECGLNLEYAFHLLYQAQGNFKEASINLLKESFAFAVPLRCLNNYHYAETESWSTREIQLFVQSLVRHEKDFFLISRDLQEQHGVFKSVKACVEFYYLWKMSGSEDYRRVRLQRRKKYRESGANPGQAAGPVTLPAAGVVASGADADSQYNLRRRIGAGGGECEHCGVVCPTARLLESHMCCPPPDFGLDLLAIGATNSPRSNNSRSVSPAPAESDVSLLDTSSETAAGFPCRLCGKVFIKVKSRNAHMKWHSEKTRAEPAF